MLGIFIFNMTSFAGYSYALQGHDTTLERGLVLRVADRGYLLRHGRVVLEGTAAELGEQRGLIEAGYLGG